MMTYSKPLREGNFSSDVIKILHCRDNFAHNLAIYLQFIACSNTVLAFQDQTMVVKTFMHFLVNKSGKFLNSVSPSGS